MDHMTNERPSRSRFGDTQQPYQFCTLSLAIVLRSSLLLRAIFVLVRYADSLFPMRLGLLAANVFMGASMFLPRYKPTQGWTESTPPLPPLLAGSRFL